MKSITSVATVLSCVLSHAALAVPVPAPKPVPAGTAVTLARPTDADEVLLRLIGVECTAATRLVRNKDGTFDGSVTCGAVTIKGKRLALENRAPDATPDSAGSVTPLSDARVASGQVTILAIGPNDLFLKRATELTGKVCNVSKALTRDATGYYAGELTCGDNRYYFAQVSVAAGSVTVPPDGMIAIGQVIGPEAGQRWRIVDAGDVYPSINTTECLTWPSPELKRKGGDNFWKGAYAPAAGDVGLVIGKSRHCNQDIDVVFLQVGAYVVPIGEKGIVKSD